MHMAASREARAAALKYSRAPMWRGPPNHRCSWGLQPTIRASRDLATVLYLAVSRDTIKFTLGKVLQERQRGLQSNRRLKEQGGIRWNAKAQLR